MKLSSHEARKLGLRVTRRAAKGRSRVKPAKGMFEAGCEAHGLPRPVPEYRFHPTRRWRFDWAWLAYPGFPENPMIALEIEGGIWTGGAHVRGKHYRSDVEKYNEARLLGWKVLRCTPEDIETGSVFALLRRAFGMEPE